MRGTRVIVTLRPGMSHDDQAAAIERLSGDPDYVYWECNNWRVITTLKQRGVIPTRWFSKGEGHRVVSN